MPISLEEERRYLHSDEVASIAFSPDGKLLGTGSVDGSSRIWDVRSSRCIRVLEQHHYYYLIEDIQFSPDQQWVLTTTADGPSSEDELGKIRVWKVGTWELVQSFSKPRGYVAFSADSRHVLFGGFETPVTAGNINDGSLTEVFHRSQDGDSLFEVYFSQNGRFALELTREEQMCLWDIPRGEIIHQTKWSANGIAHVWPVNRLVGVTLDEPAMIVLLSLDNLRLLREFPSTAVGFVAMDLSPTTGTLVACDTLLPLRFWDSSTGESIAVVGNTDRFGRTEAFRFSPVDNLLATSWFEIESNTHNVVGLRYKNE